MTAIVGTLLTPSGMAYILFVLGLLAAVAAKRWRLSWALLAASGAITVVSSSGAFATILMSPLEYEYPALHDARKYPEIQDIVVLTGYAADDGDMPLTGRLNYASAYRVLLALELHQSCATCRVIVSGNAETASVMGEALISLGVPEEQLQLESASNTTAESAANLRPLLQKPFFLVTSSGHLRRSMAVLQHQGLQPVPAPTDYQGPKDWRNANLLPAPQWLVASDLAVHEYLGAWWYRLKGAL